MSRFFKPYEGGKPFLFISYPHKNSAEVLDTIRILHDKGIRLWYDEGIPAGSDWPANIARQLGDCEAVRFFLAERALAYRGIATEQMPRVREVSDALEDIVSKAAWPYPSYGNLLYRV